jgi:hypothetical protein
MNAEFPLTPTPEDVTPDPRRVRRIVDRAQREVAMREMINFGVGRVWVAIIGIGGAIFGFLYRRSQQPIPRNRTPDEEGS